MSQLRHTNGAAVKAGTVAVGDGLDNRDDGVAELVELVELAITDAPVEPFTPELAVDTATEEPLGLADRCVPVVQPAITKATAKAPATTKTSPTTGSIPNPLRPLLSFTRWSASIARRGIGRFV